VLLAKQCKPLEARKYLITDANLDNTVHRTNQCILIIQPNISRVSDAKLTDKIEIIAFIGPLCLAGARTSNQQSLEELRVTDGDGTEKFA
jgi:hypothetical protein